MPGRGRYAPSPSGPLHLGNLRTALLAWLFARHAGGSFVLRIEDLDRDRVRPGATDQMIRDLRRLGLDWDEGPDLGGPFAPYTQSERLPLYQRHIDFLVAGNLAYPCYCSRSDIAAAAQAPNAPLSGTRPYSGSCRDPDRRERRRRAHPTRPPAYRFKLDTGLTVFRDAVRGECRFACTAGVDDFVIRRADGVPAYQLAVVVDDALMRVGQVVRGDDLLDSTPRQIALYQAFGYTPPAWAHVPLVRDESGNRLAKRDHSVAGDIGDHPEMLVGQLAASCGLTEPGVPCTVHRLLAEFDPARLAPQPGL